MKKHLSLITLAFFISTIILFDSAYAAVSDGCEIFEIKAGCDLSVWMAVILGEIVVDKPMANVGVKLGKTTNLSNYESLRVDVSLFMPSDTDKKSLNKTFKRCLKWCDNKMTDILKDEDDDIPF